MSILDKMPSNGKPRGDMEFLVDEDHFAQEFPGIWEILARCRWKGNPRQTGTLMLFCEPGRPTVCLLDRARGEKCFYASSGFMEALEGLERALQEGKGDWRPDKGQYRYKRTG